MISLWKTKNSFVCNISLVFLAVEESTGLLNHLNVTICLSSDGTERLEGEIWTLSSCLSCTCHGGQVMCAAPECPPTPCTSPKLVDCCLQCPSDQDIDKDGHNSANTATAPPAAKNCLSDDSEKTYTDGEMWKVCCIFCTISLQNCNFQGN